jgi:exodeoxyribonuclease VII large subunit
MRNMLNSASSSLAELSVRLSGLDPALPLQRGYALVQKTDGGFLRKPREVSAGDDLEVILAGGRVPVSVRAEHE